MTKRMARWGVSILALIGIVASIAFYWPDERAIGVAVLAVLAVMMVGVYLVEKIFGPQERRGR